MDGSTPGFPVLHYLPEFAQTQVRSVGVSGGHFPLPHGGVSVKSVCRLPLDGFPSLVWAELGAEEWVAS